MTITEMKDFIKSSGNAHLVKELVEGLGMSVEDAVSYVYDTLTLTKEQLVAKYF